MKSPPPQLFVRGKFPAPENHKYLCVVGSRKYTAYGQHAVRTIINGLYGYPITIVSGLAIGIDSISHQAALEAGLHCVAFPGSTLDWGELYPQSRLHVAKSILDAEGALVSSWEAGYPTKDWAFPARNRLMAGLSHATLVIEAARGSGSLMTAKHAEEFYRDVLAVPGSFDNSQSYGPHMLIRKGACLVSSASDVLEALGFTPPTEAEIFKSKMRDLDTISISIMKKVSIKKMSVDSLIDELGISAPELYEKLSILELRRFISVDGTMVRLTS